jgi:hypothetical protein
MFRPFGNLLRLPDGRTLQKQTNGVWIDVNSGVKMNDTMVGNLMYSSVFYGVPDGGVGKTPRATIIGIIGSVTITQWLQQTRSSTDSLDMVFIGDSNVAYSDGGGFDAQGLADNFLLAGICSGMINYGTPIFPVGGDATQPYNLLGYNNYNNGWATNANLGWTNGNKYGLNEFKNQYGISLGTFSPNGITSNFAGFAWLDAGKSGASNLGATWYLGNTAGRTGLNAGLSLTARFIIGSTGATGGGMIRIVGFDSTGSRYIGDNASDYLNITFTGGFTAYEKDITKTGGIGLSAMNFYFGGLNSPSFYCTGPMAFASYSVYNPVKGLATHSLQNQSGYSLGGLYNDQVRAGPAASNNTILNYFKEYYTRQIKAGGSGRVCVVIEGGVNADSSPSATVDYTKNMVTLLTSEWARAGLPSDKLTFLCMNTWEGTPGSSWTTNLPSIAGDMSAYAKTNGNVTYINILNFGGTYNGLTASGYYQPGDSTHLTKPGYKYISQNIIDALLKYRTL